MFMSEKATATIKELDILDPALFQRTGWYVTGNWGDTLFTCFYKPNACQTTALGGAAAYINSASSLHPGGVNVLMGDGSVRFVKESVNSWAVNPVNGQPVGASSTSAGWWANFPQFGIWQALATRNCGEVVDEESL